MSVLSPGPPGPQQAYPFLTLGTSVMPQPPPSSLVTNPLPSPQKAASGPRDLRCAANSSLSTLPSNPLQFPYRRRLPLPRDLLSPNPLTTTFPHLNRPNPPPPGGTSTVLRPPPFRPPSNPLPSPHKAPLAPRTSAVPRPPPPSRPPSNPLPSPQKALSAPGTSFMPQPPPSRPPTITFPHRSKPITTPLAPGTSAVPRSSPFRPYSNPFSSPQRPPAPGMSFVSQPPPSRPLSNPFPSPQHAPRPGTRSQIFLEPDHINGGALLKNKSQKRARTRMNKKIRR